MKDSKNDNAVHWSCWRPAATEQKQVQLYSVSKVQEETR